MFYKLLSSTLVLQLALQSTIPLMAKATDVVEATAIVEDAPLLPKNTASPLTSLTEARSFANNLIQEIKNSPNSVGKKKNDPLVVLHIGETIPQELNWVIVHLNRAHIFFEFNVVKPSELQEFLKKNQEHFSEQDTARYLRYTNPQSAELAPTKEKVSAASEKIRQIFGIPAVSNLEYQIPFLPKGLTYWFSVPRTSEIKKIDGNRSLTSAGFAMASLGVSAAMNYAAKGQTFDYAAVARGTTALGVWVWANMFWFRAVHEVMSQGKTLKQVKGKWQVMASNVFFWPSNFVRSIVSNLIVQGFLQGPGMAFGWDGLSNNAINSLANMPARSRVDKWVADKTPTTKDENGNIIVKEGQWSQKGAARVNFWWNTGYGFLKNLQLLGVSWVFDVVYLSLAVFNIGWVLKDNWSSIKTSLSTSNVTARLQREECSTILK